MLNRSLALTVALSSLVFADVAESSWGSGHCRPIQEERNLRIVSEWVAGLLAGSPDIERYWAPSATLTLPASLPYGGSYTRDELPAYGFALGQYWELGGGEGTPALYADCDRVFLVGRWTATSLSTGQFVDQPLVEEFVLMRGRIVQDTLFFFDTQALLDALGLN